MSAAAGDESVRIDTVKVEELERLLPLVEDCQLAAGVPDVERGRNRGYFGRLIAPSQFGALIAAWRGRQAIGFTCLHWTLDSVGVRETVTLHVLYVAPALLGGHVKHVQRHRLPHPDRVQGPVQAGEADRLAAAPGRDQRAELAGSDQPAEVTAIAPALDIGHAGGQLAVLDQRQKPLQLLHLHRVYPYGLVAGVPDVERGRNRGY